MGGTLWVVAALGLLILELIGPAYVFCWFAAGALAAGLASLLGLRSPTDQVLVFAVSSTLLVLASRTVFRRFLFRTSPGAAVRMNAAALPGESARVLQPIDNARGEGQVMLHGMEWTARSLDDKPIPEGARVRVIQVDGVKLIVDREEEIP